MTAGPVVGGRHAPERHQGVPLGGDAGVGVDARGHPGARHPRRHRVDADAVGAELLREHAAQHDDGRLARTVGPEARVDVASRHGGDRHDAAARGAERGMRRLRKKPRRPRVHREEPVPVLDRVLDERSDPVDAGVADEPVETAEALDGRPRRGPARPACPCRPGGGGHRRPAPVSSATSLSSLAPPAPTSTAATCGVRPGRLRVPGEPDAGRAADPARCSRHENTHAVSSSIRRRPRSTHSSLRPLIGGGLGAVRAEWRPVGGRAGGTGSAVSRARPGWRPRARAGRRRSRDGGRPGSPRAPPRAVPWPCAGRRPGRGSCCARPVRRASGTAIRARRAQQSTGIRVCSHTGSKR